MICYAGKHVRLSARCRSTFRAGPACAATDHDPISSNKPLEIPGAHGRLDETRRLSSPSSSTDLSASKPTTSHSFHGSEGETHAVNIAIASNVFIFSAKLFVSQNSGSSALLSEAVHTLADIGALLPCRPKGISSLEHFL
jgi:hypothetical protein